MVKGSGKLLEMAVAHSPESRALLFRHLCGLFLNNTLPPAYEDRQALYEILRLLLPKVDTAIRRELCDTLIALDHPPIPLLRLLVDDVEEVSGPLLEKAKFPDLLLFDLISHGNDWVRAKLRKRREAQILSAWASPAEPFAETPAPVEEPEVAAAARVTPVEAPPPPPSPAPPPIVVAAPEPQPAMPPRSSPEPTATPRTPGPSLSDIEEAGKAIRRQRGHLQDIVRAATDWQWETDRNGRLTYVSDSATQAFGLPPAALLGMQILDLLTPVNDQRQGYSLEKTLEKMRPFDNFLAQSRSQNSPDGQWRLRAVPVFDYDSGRFLGFRGAAVALAPRRHDHPLPTAMARDSKPISAPAGSGAAPPPGDSFIDPAMLMAVQNLSHELRTPLNAILGFSEMIAMGSLGPVDDRYQDYARRIVAAGQHLHNIISEVLEYAPLVAGKIRPKLRSLSLAQSVRAAIQETTPDAARKPLSISLQPEAVPAIVACDSQFLDACLKNILKAAIAESAPQSSLTLMIRSLPDGAVEVRVPVARGDSGREKATSPLFDLYLAFAREIAKPLHCAVEARPDRKFTREIVLVISPADTAA